MSVPLASKAQLDALAASLGILQTQIFDPDDVGSDVVLVAGQSNAAGYGGVGDTTYLDPPDPRILQFAGSGVYLGKVVQAIDPLLHHLQATSLVAGVGFPMTWARDYVRTIPENRSVLLVPTAHSGTGFTTGLLLDWSVDAGPGSLYEFAISQTNAALALNSKNRLIGIFWHQGESDTSLTQLQYQAELDAMIEGWRARITGASDVPFVIGQMVPDGIIATPARAPINLAHIDTPRRKTRAAFVYGPSGVTDDLTHYTAAGQRTLGHSFFDALPVAEANVLGVPAIPPTAPTLVQAGTTVNVAWSQPLCRVTDYHVEYSTGSGWSTLTRTSPNIARTAAITGLILGATLQVRITSVNEEGSSAPSAVGSVTLAQIPGQVTGLAGTPTSHTIPLTWNTVAGAAQYAMQYRTTSGPGAWSVEQVVSATSSSGTIAGLSSATGYDIRVTARNGAGDGTPSSILPVTTAAPTAFSLDVPVTPFAEWSLRRLRSGYAGSAIRVRRSSDSTELDIGFVADVLDTAALLTFTGGGDGFVKTWYDQSGNGRDLTQATAANQPRIVLAGVVNVSGTRPALFFDGTNDVMARTGAGSTGLLAGSGISLLSVVAAGANQVVFTEDNVAGVNTGRWAQWIQPLVVPGMIIANDVNTQTIRSGGTMVAGVQHQHSIVDSLTNILLALDGLTTVNGSYSRSGVYTPDRIQVGALASGLRLSGYLAECVVWDSPLSSLDRQSGEANQQDYYGTP